MKIIPGIILCVILLIKKMAEGNEGAEGQAMAEKSKKDKQAGGTLRAGIFFLTIAGSVLAAFLYRKPVQEIAGIGILSGVGAGVIWFLLAKAGEDEGFLQGNGGNPKRFAFLYLVSLVGSVLFPLLPAGGWPYQVIFIGLMLFSSQLTGICAGCQLLMISVLLQGAGSGTFFIYFISGLVGIAVFTAMDKAFKIWTPMLICLVMQMVCLSLQEVLFANEVFSFHMFFIPEINILVNFVLLTILLKIFKSLVVNGKQDRYGDINDPEHPLLLELMADSRDEYFHAVHTAYLCEKAAKRLGLDHGLAKACGYYHRIGIIRGENSWEKTRDILQANNFPAEVQNILQEYLDERKKIISKETVVLFFCDTVISSISYLLSKDAQIDLDYRQIIGAILDKKIESGIIASSELSFGEVEEIKNILAEEKNYYDFLR